MTLVVGGAVLVVVLLVGTLLWRTRGATLKEDEGTLIEASEGKPPLWVNQEFYRDNDNIYFSGNSGFLSSKDDAINEASAAAVERAANQLGNQVPKGKWIDVVQTQYTAQRAKTLAELEKTTLQGDVAKISSVRKAVAEARLRVAKLLHRTAGNLAPTENSGFYWEKYQTGGGVRYRAFARYTINKPNFEKLVESYTRESEALGIRAVTVFPGLGWRYPELDEAKGGAIIMGVSDKSPFAMVGFTEGDVVTEINDRTVRDGAKFAEAFLQEYQSGCALGGKLHFKIQHGDRPPADYALNIPRGCSPGSFGPAVQHSIDRGPRPVHHGRRGKASNIWDEILNDNPED
jgi:hypothetical protein